ncbi:UbiA family prenyltransferase [Desulfocurvus sp.]|jgi:protoheme IX farnesyltransferase|uniref:UbiA family prenyltransferase n=1 Tax=Desulfocurvus sp. TaxID=2871698 RepID=UPI0025BBC6EE|nr:UbiA family prenyltransferase [Desulfocurvus sp.]MCK9240479.1 UbiA family prenyltransferase [Desulfocurvus sp.]
MTAADLLALARPGVSLAVGGAALCGALLAGGGAGPGAALAVAGAVLLCAGCSALNQVQERQRDARMARTADRPLPCGRVAPGAALGLGLGLCAGGLGLFALGGGAALAGLGLGVLALYNGLYTPLKPRTGAALLVGALAGALPPLCGWLGAGGEAWGARAPLIWAVTVMVYLWQVPHFWLLAWRRRAEYQRAGFAPPFAALPARSRGPVLALWTAAYCVGIGLALALALGGAAGGAGAAGGLAAAGLAAGLALAAVVPARGARALAAVNGSMLLALAGTLLAAWPF